MHILPISFFNMSALKQKPVSRENRGLTLRPQLTADTISFGHVAENAWQLRRLIKFGLPDFWTGKPPIESDVFDEMMKKKDFNKTVKTVVKMVAPLKESLQEVPLKIFNMLENYSRINPDMHLDEIFRQWAPLAHVELYNIQKPLFEKMVQISKALPEEKKTEFDVLIEKTLKQIEQRPIEQEFNKRDFRYKLGRIAQKIKKRNVPEEISAINKLIKMSGYIPSFPSKLKKLNKKNERKQRDIVQNQKVSIRQIKNFFERSVISKDEELQGLMNDVNCQINGIKVFIPFSRLNFIEAIENLVQDIEDKSVARKLLNQAYKLPTANQETSAFIVKASRKPSEKIGYDWLLGCVGNIDHIDLHSKGGKDGPSNYVVATNCTNSERSNRTFAQQLRAHPEGYETAQIYINKLIEFSKNGILKMVGLNNAYVKNLVRTLERRSPSEKPLKLDISNLK